MLRYEGKRGDKAYGGGAYVREHGYGFEYRNFKNLNGRYYGYVSPHGETIHIERLGVSLENGSVPGVTIVWTAPRRNYGQVVVGWYKNATAYRKPRQDPRYHFFSARVSDCKLLSASERTLIVPRGKGAMGQSNVWYTDTPKGRHFIERVELLMAGKLIVDRKRKHGGRPWQQDMKTRLRIERRAVEIVARHFERRGYMLTDVQKDSKGWDLEAVKGRLVYRLEVKGLGGQFEGVELTPNEYEAMTQYRETFCLCVVSGLETRQRDQLHIYEYSPEEHAWIESSGGRLDIIKRKRISARCSPL